MKTLFWGFIFCFTQVNAFAFMTGKPETHIKVKSASETEFTDNDKLASLCKIWGFLKYYHPEVASGKLDWDKELIIYVNKVSEAKDKDQLSKIYSDWINSLGKTKHYTKTTVPDSLKFNLNLGWVNDQHLFSDSLISKLNYIVQHRNTGKNYYVSQTPFVGNTIYKNEKPYKDSVFPGTACRLLSLFRYWNIVNYFYPYKYKMDENWNSVLDDMIPGFRDAKDTITYHLAMMELTAHLDDSHASFGSRYTWRYFGYRYVPFQFTIIDEKAVVTGFLNDSLAAINDIKTGDVILKIDGKDLAGVIAEKSKYIGASNEPTRMRNMRRYLFNGISKTFEITFERNGVTSNKTINRYVNSEIYGQRFLKAEKKKKKEQENNNVENWKILGNNIGYLDLTYLMPDQVDDAMKHLMSTDALIIDVRNYPNGTMYKIAKYLEKEKKAFVKFTAPMMSYPGVFEWSGKPMQCGGKNKNYYKGKVVLLVNETTQSHAEFTCMALQTAPNVKIIGSQTAGADGNVSLITFPGGYMTYMTGIGVYYPDGRETQRIGIVPDIVCQPTIEGIRAHKDEVLGRAIEYCKTGK